MSASNLKLPFSTEIIKKHLLKSMYKTPFNKYSILFHSYRLSTTKKLHEKLLLMGQKTQDNHRICCNQIRIFIS